MAAKIKKGDKVVVLTGRDKGAKGVVLEVRPTESRVVVEGVNRVKRHARQSAQNPQGGIQTFEAAIHVSNVAHVDPRDGKPTRVGFRTDDGGRKIRFAKRSGEAIDV